MEISNVTHQICDTDYTIIAQTKVWRVDKTSQVYNPEQS